MKYYVGIDLGGTFVKGGIVDEKGKIVVKDKIPTGKERGFEAVAADMAKFVLDLIKRAGVTAEGIGVGSPGTVNSKDGVIIYGNNLKWSFAPLGEALQKATGLKTFVTNDANAAALGESFCGAGEAYGDSILVTLGTGVGGGIVLDGKLYEGGKSAGAEIGHMVVRAGGERCTCGRRGCFEAYSSATALIRDTKRAMEKDKNSGMWSIVKGDISKVDGKTAFDGMRLGDKTATRVVNRYVENLAEGLANLANIFRPEIILLGGGVSAERETLLAPLRIAVDKRLYGGTTYAPLVLKTASLGNDAGLCGAARFAMLNL